MLDYGLLPYQLIIVMMMTGLYVLMAKQNLVKKIIGLNLFQASVIMLYVTWGKIEGGTAPIFTAEDMERLARHEAPQAIYSNPVPHVLMLTAIVVGIATTALALALVTRIHEAYGSIEEDEIRSQEDEP